MRGAAAFDAARSHELPMPDQVNFELVSPERLLLSEPVDMVVVPGTEGNFGVLPGHALFISTMRPGMIDVYQGRHGHASASSSSAALPR